MIDKNDVYLLYTHISQLNIFTISSIKKILKNIFYQDEQITSIIEKYDHILDTFIIETLKSNNKFSLINENDLNEIKNITKNNLSIRQFMFLNYGILDKITVQNLIKILNNNNLQSISNYYQKLDPYIELDLIDDIFRPLEDDNHPLIVIMPSYNNKNTLKETLNSIYMQEYDNYRVIIIDDQSGIDEINLIQNIIINYNQSYRTILIEQIIRQRQCAGRYIGYHMSYDDEIVLFLDGDDQFYKSTTMNIINNIYKNGYGMTYGSYVDEFHGKIYTEVIKGTEEYPEEIIGNRWYRYYHFITAHLRTAYAKLFKNIKLYDLLDNDDMFLHLLTDYAEMIPALEMITKKLNDNDKFDKLKQYFYCVKEPIYLYNYGNSLNYTTSYVRKNEKGNENEKKYRIDCAKKIRKLPMYDFILDQQKNTYKNYFISIMNNYNFDILIVDVFNDNNHSSENTILNKLFSHNSLFLTGKIINHKINRSVELDEHKLNINNEIIKAIIVYTEYLQIVIKDITDIKKKYYVISKKDTYDNKKKYLQIGFISFNSA